MLKNTAGDNTNKDVGNLGLDPALITLIQTMPVLNKILPYNFADGVGHIDHMSVDCGNRYCHENIPTESIRGEFVEPHNSGETVNFTGYALCYKCHSITPVKAQFNSDGTFIYGGDDGWSRGRWGSGVAPPLFGKYNKIFVKGFPPILAGAVLLWWILFHW
jgi:hypothetical protein